MTWSTDQPVICYGETFGEGRRLIRAAALMRPRLATLFIRTSVREFETSDTNAVNSKTLVSVTNTSLHSS